MLRRSRGWIRFHGWVLSALLFAVLSPSAWSADAPQDSYWQRHRDGWFWYQDPPPATVKKPLPEPPPAPVTPTAKALADFEAMQKTLEELKKVAIMAPSEDNLKAYMRYQQMVMARSSVFADSWQRAVWTDPTLDYAAQGRPTNNFGLDVYDAERKKTERATVAELAKTHGLFFFFRSDCPYCHRFAPVLKRFEQEYGIQVFPVSLDGGGLPEYPVAAIDNGIAARLNVASVPALFLATPSGGSIQPIGFGVMAEREIAERLHALTRTKPGERF